MTYVPPQPDKDGGVSRQGVVGRDPNIAGHVVANPANAEQAYAAAKSAAVAIEQTPGEAAVAGAREDGISETARRPM